MNKIKNIMKSKITVIALACLLLVGIFAGISSLAGDSQPIVEITAVNLSHEATPTIMYEVTISGIKEPVDPSDVEMKFWNERNYDVTKAADDTATYANKRVELDDFDAVAGVQTLYCYSQGFAPKEMTNVVYASATYKGVYSPVVNYSIFQYLCEANLNGGSEQQLALWDAMERYITYAQLYLGYTDSATPADLGYVSVENGYFTVGEGTDKYTAGTFLNGTNITLYSELEEGLTFGAWVRENGAMITDTAENNTYLFAVVAGEHSVYTAISMTKVTYSGTGTLVQVEIGTTTGGTQPTYVPVKRLVTGESLDVIKLDGKEFVLTAPATKTDAEGNVSVFSHWANESGEVLSKDLTYFCDSIVDYGSATFTLDASPVYNGADVTYDIAANAANATVSSSVSSFVPSFEKLDNGFTVDAATNPKTGYPNCTATVTSASQTVDGTYDSVVYTMKFNFPVVGDGTQVNYLYKKGNQRLVKNALKINNGNIVQFSFFVDGTDSNTTVPNGYFLSIDQSDTNDFRADAIMKFGETYELTFDCKLDNTSGYKTQTISAYIDGVYFGSVSGIAFGTANGNATMGYSATTQGRFCGIITVTDPKAYAYLAK